MALTVTVKDDEKVHPRVAKVDVGHEEVTFHCESHGCTQWFFMLEYDHPVNIPISRKNSLTIRNIKTKRAGYYYCYGEYKNSRATFLAMAELRVYGKKLKKRSRRF